MKITLTKKEVLQSYPGINNKPFTFKIIDEVGCYNSNYSKTSTPIFMMFDVSPNTNTKNTTNED